MARGSVAGLGRLDQAPQSVGGLRVQRDHAFGTVLEPADGPDLPVAEPLVRTEIKFGYARVSTGGQKLERQLDDLTAAGCRKMFIGRGALLSSNDGTLK
ncbi:recombinase family protein [Streptomyces sp. NPDC001933]|uniref:recombinase family protein n=1 Tax=Streptomyces sp. NPDC001933 TaxID=3364626 RepID=UPI00369AF97D